MTAVRPLILLGLFAVSACAPSAPPTGQALADQQTREACRRRADQFDAQQNRAEIYSPPPQVNTPFSANYLPDQQDRGLSRLYAHDRMVADCIRNSGTGAIEPASTPGKPPSWPSRPSSAPVSSGPTSSGPASSGPASSGPGRSVPSSHAPSSSALPPPADLQ
ncbi:MAG TPA: hypothetical protein VHB27_24205 [Rhodopila sp.]|uniref:hypothetical protein n=1 Tax=Rhodopila sp. TaxID=2480087 RepID=UPI002CEE415B|nr:hypothetical protein [Rhodopila sp.]HVY18345.1 hypothetical protein [Rhodopila sp.]